MGYDSSIEVKKEEELYSNREIIFFENYDYSVYFDCIIYIIDNYHPLFITGYKINTQVEYFLNIKYNFSLIKKDIYLSIKDCHLSLYKKQNTGIEIIIINDDTLTYSIKLIIGNINLSKYNQDDLRKIILE